MKRLASLSLLCVLATLGGCAAFLPRLVTPRLSIVNVRIVSANFWSQRLDVRVRVENPNAMDLSVLGVRYALDIEGQRFATGACTQAFTVPANGSADFDTEVTANMGGALLAMLSHGAHQAIHYRLHGKVKLAHGWLRTLPFDQQGAFTLQ